MPHTLNFLLAGVGGQGAILAGDVLANVGLAAGLVAKQAEVHGMSQRGGDVTSYVRWGRTVYSPLAGAGEVDVLVGFEKVEALRSLPRLRPGGMALISTQAIEPVTVTSGDQPYPDDARLRAAVAQAAGRAVYVDAVGIAAAAGSSKAANVVMLGALSAMLESGSALQRLGVHLTPQAWLDIIAERVPLQYVELNCRAFEGGRQAVPAAEPS